MANPQPDKFTKFSNELFEAYIKITRVLSPYENATWLCIFRKTYGFNKKEAWVSLNQIGIATNIKQSHVARAIKKLIDKNMITHTGEKGKTYSTAIQKDYESWLLPKQVLPKQVVALLPKQVTTTTQAGSQLLPKQVDIKESIKESTKERGAKDTLAPPQRYFYSKYQEKLKEPYVPDYGKDGAIFKRLRTVLPDDKITALIDRFFESEDDFIKRAGWTTGVFRAQVNSLRKKEKEGIEKWLIKK